MQPAGARALELLVDAPLNNGDVDTRQPQLTSQHQSGRTTADNDDRMFKILHFLLLKSTKAVTF